MLLFFPCLSHFSPLLLVKQENVQERWWWTTDTVGYEVCVFSFIPFSWVKRKALSSGIFSGNGITLTIIKMMVAFPCIFEEISPADLNYGNSYKLIHCIFWESILCVAFNLYCLKLTLPTSIFFCCLLIFYKCLQISTIFISE